MVIGLIIGGEIGFWVLLAAGLVARYLVRWHRLSTVLLIGVPLVDVVVLAATAVDLHRGGTATDAHGLAAAYLGFSVAFGPSMVRWADQRVAHRFAGGPPPWKPPKRGWPRARHEWREWAKALLAVGISGALLGAAILLVGDPDRTAALTGWIARLAGLLAIWLVAFPVWATAAAAVGRR
ncbi:hypothetical protein [Rhizomonospora bruguierae]|uniref:hypothetical protein n=1 Tax=Rhizomonospora bruguierae TaxID=1581705 RepID=UPI001BD0853F|nr:hypothetical protein [Micromonospora sp. NBRC 107566]